VYDTINRLTEENHYNASDTLTHSAAYKYDLAGNRTQTVINGVTNVYTLGTGNRLQSVTSAQSADVSFAYDAAGNTTNIVTGTNSLALSWNEKYQLTSAVQDSLFDIQYSYDVLGRRTSRFVVPPSGGATNVEHYIYNGNQVAADLDGSGNVIRTYTWGPGIDNLLAMTLHPAITNSTDLTISTPLTLYPIKDHQNSVLAFTDASGTIVESYEYDAWGNVTVYDSNTSELETSHLGNRYLFQGREYDFQTQLYYFRARWYNPETGRWLSKDPLGEKGGLNLYLFCGNNPVNFIDPLGLQDYMSGLEPRDNSTVDANITTGPDLGPGPNAPQDFSGTPFPLDSPSTGDLFVSGASTMANLGPVLGGVDDAAAAALKGLSDLIDKLNDLIDKLNDLLDKLGNKDTDKKTGCP
jgi:RHS repeat-associated protein